MYGVSIHICSDENADSNRTLKTYFILILSHNALRPSSQPSKKVSFPNKTFRFQNIFTDMDLWNLPVKMGIFPK